MALLGAFNQVQWGGVGDADECWIIATFWPLVASGVVMRSELPSIATFRAAAGKPDRPGPTGGNNRDLVRALDKLFPDADVKFFIGTASAFFRQLQLGYVASLSVLSSKLPAYLRFGFNGSHQVSVIYQKGKYYVMNPLAREGSALIQISERDLARAAGALLRDGKVHAVLIRAGKNGKSPTPNPKPRPGDKPTARLPRDFNYQVVVRNYIDPYAAGMMYKTRRRRPSLDDNVDSTQPKR